MLKLQSPGIISRNEVTAQFEFNQAMGIRFVHPSGEHIEANHNNIFSTQRNTVLAKNGKCICLTEHFMAAASVLGVDNIDLILSEEELPFGDGSAKLWLDFFRTKIPKAIKPVVTKYQLQEAIKIEDEEDDSRYILLEPNDLPEFSYKLVMPSTVIGTQEFTWSAASDVSDLLCARTFSSEAENQMLGLSGWVLGYDDQGFCQELLFANEPACHKVLDLIGDLYLSGINPLSIAMRVNSHKGGHALNARAAKKLAEIFE